MSIGLILTIVLVLIMLGGVAPWGAYPDRAHFYGGGPYVGGGIGLVLVIILILVLLGHI